MAAKVSISDGGQGLEGPIKGGSISFFYSDVKDASLVNPGVCCKIVHFSTKIKEAGEEMHREK
jgi:hypothetical protein